MSDELKKTVEDLRESKEKINAELKKAAESSEDVKSGVSTVDEELQEPSTILFNAITDMSVKILEDPVINQQFAVLAKEISNESVNALITTIAIAMTHSAYNSIAFYDGLLKEELDKQFKNIGHHVNLLKADVDGYSSVIKVMRTQIDDISKKLQVDAIKKLLQ